LIYPKPSFIVSLFLKRSSDQRPVLRRIGLAPRLSDVGEYAIEERVGALADFILLGVGRYLNEGSRDQEEGEDVSAGEDEENTEVEEKLEVEALDFARDVDNSVKCLMDLIPSMEQVIRLQGKKNLKGTY